MDFAPALVSAAALPNCNACHKAPVTNPGYSTCRPCRDKRNEMKKRSQQKKREQKFRLLQSITGSDNIPAPAPRPAEKSASSAKKRKAPEDGGDLADALERMRKRFKKMDAFKKVDVASKPTPAAAPSGPEPAFEKFVVATDLHKAIKRRYPDNSNSLRFYGTYAIIALPDVDNKHRARQVARDLRDNTTLHFNLDNKESYRNGTAYTIHYKCTCRTSIKRTASDLSLYFASKNKTASEETPKSECRGRIEICAEDDRSHPQGWLGQRVKVTITHPKKI